MKRPHTRTLVHLAPVLLASSMATAASAQDSTYGGTTGPDMSIAAIEPDGAPVTTGLAGDYPADIARFLLASGARNAKLSPDASTVAFTLDVTGQPEIWSVPATGGQPRQVTFRTGVDEFHWMPDGSALLYGADRDGNEQPGYFAISPDGARERTILPARKGDFRIFGDFASDGRFVYSSTARNGSDFDIYQAQTDGTTRLVREGKFAFMAPSLSPDGARAIVTEAVGEDADNLYLLDMDSGALETISAPRSRASHSVGGFAWKRDGSGFFFSSNAGREFAALRYYDVARKATELVAQAPSDIANVVLCGAQDRYLAWTVETDGFSTLHVRDRAENRDLAAPDLPEGTLSLDCQGDDPVLMVAINGWRTPGDVWTLHLASGTVRQAYAGSLAGLDPARLVRPQVVRYPARDGVELQGLLYRPEGAGSGDDAPPVLFVVHGGPSGASGPTFDPVAQYHVNRGMAVFEPNVRGSTGLGRTYSTLDDRRKRLDSVRDLVDLLGALDAQGLVDGDRAAVAGGSYGGYMVNAVLAAYPGTFKAGAALYGVADWVTALEVASPGLKASDRMEYGDITLPEWKAFYRENSPIRQADRITVPVLYSHGVMDPRIDIAESETMVRTLRKNGIEAPFIRMPDEGHGWRKLENKLFYYRKQAEFIEDQLGIGK